MAMRELGEAVRNARGAMTSKELAQRSGVDPSKLSKLQAGTLKETPPPHELEGLAKTLGLPQHVMLKLLGYEVGPVTAEKPPDPADPREQFIARVRRLKWTPGLTHSLGFAIGVIEREQGIKGAGE